MRLNGTRNKKETIQVKKTIAAGATYSASTSLFQLIRADGNIQRIYGQFNQGQQGQLQVRPYLQMTGERSEELVTYPASSQRYLSGDDTRFDISVDFDVRNGDKIKVDVTNASAFDYTLDISFEVDYVGGTSRVV